MRLLSAVIKIAYVYPWRSPVGLYLRHYLPPSTIKYRRQFDGNAERFHFYAAGWNRVQWLGRGGRERDGEAEASFAAFRGIDCALGASFSRVNSRVSRKMRRERDGKHDGERGGAFTASTYLRAHLSPEVCRPAGFPGPFPQLLSISLSSSFFRSHHQRPSPSRGAAPTFSFIDCLLPVMVNPH